MAKKRILVTAEQLASRLSEPDLVVVDCRFDLADVGAGRAAFAAGHIPGAVFLDLDTDLSGPIRDDSGRHPLPDPQRLAATFGDAGISSQHSVVVYDDASGAVAARAWWLLRWLGHERVGLLEGGMTRWRALGLPTESGSLRRAPVTFEGRVRPDLVITTRELAADLPAIAGLNLMDARDAARFRGELEPIDPVAGHIPGAKSVPFADFVATDGTWLDLEDRRRRLLAALGDDPSADWCVMCGSGVTACHLAVSGIEAGLREPRVYVGSWSEWIRDASRPIARGES